MSQTRPLTIALDAMGGDHAPLSVVDGVEKALPKLPADAQFLFFGDEAQIAQLLAKKSWVSRTTIVPTTSVITNDDKPTTVLRKAGDSSMNRAIESVARGDADCIISGGNTGALMVLARKHLKTLPGIDRPAIATPLPTIRGRTIALDLGANIDCTPDNLLQFAVLGAVYAQAILGIDQPTIGILNVGEEEQKGNDLVRNTAALLRATTTLPGKFIGFIEGDDISKGKADVAVMDGFTGNIMLKTMEGTAKFIGHMLREAATSSLLAKISAVFSIIMLRKLRARMDPRDYNGAMFLGLGGVCVKSHGGTDARGFASAVDVAANLVIHKFNETVARDLNVINNAHEQAA
ncbi:MAG TPA: phosphate acyltransferase PlsX [Alphaproteobacteria bacterium]